MENLDDFILPQTVVYDKGLALQKKSWTVEAVSGIMCK
jgi:hypothetical protein